MALRISLLLAIGGLCSCARGQSIVVGVLEDVPPRVYGQSDHRAIRIVFQKEGKEWRAFPSNCPDQECLSSVASQYPQRVAWTIGFDGKALGEIVGVTPERFAYYADIGLQAVTIQTNIPTIGKKSAEFAGYTDTSVYRPLVANSEPFVRDPELWKRAVLGSETSLRLRQQFRRKFRKLCKLGADEQSLTPFPYRDENIKIVRSYTSKNGVSVARLHLDGAVDCGDTEAGFDLDDPWFAVETDKSVRYLDSGLLLVDTGDYDNDGHSELIFAINRNNRGGYEMFYDNVKKQAVFEYTFH